MPALRRPRRTVGRDPAPSRLTYRFTRFWLSPVTRWLVLVVLPLGFCAGAAVFWLTRPAQQATIALWADRVWASVEARPEFRINHMAITGAAPDLADAIRARLDLDFPVSWFDIDTAAIHEAASALDAVADLTVTLELGGALRLEIVEREPAVLWRRAGRLEILDAQGHRIAFVDRRDGFAALPLITGAGADRAVPEALALVEIAAPIHDRLRALTRQGARRWDAVLDRGQVIRLPEQGARSALRRVLAMHAAQDLLNRDLPVIDMRLPDRPTVRLGEDALEYLRMARAFEEGLKRQ